MSSSRTWARSWSPRPRASRGRPLSVIPAKAGIQLPCAEPHSRYREPLSFLVFKVGLTPYRNLAAFDLFWWVGERTRGSAGDATCRPRTSDRIHDVVGRCPDACLTQLAGNWKVCRPQHAFALHQPIPAPLGRHVLTAPEFGERDLWVRLENSTVVLDKIHFRDFRKQREVLARNPLISDSLRFRVR